MPKDICIVIAHRGPLLGLWATIESCIAELEQSPRYSYEFVVVVNGEEQNFEHLKIRASIEDDHLGAWIHRTEPLSPPTARQLGVEQSTGKVIFFFDNHCLPKQGYFHYAMRLLEREDVDIAHGVTLPASIIKLYHYRILRSDLEKNFWGAHRPEPARAEPYRISMGNHSAIAIKRSVWNEIGGYWKGFTGYGGEEPYFDLKACLLGKNVWLDPRMEVLHYFSERGYTRSATDEFFVNMMMCANIIGGHRWLNAVARNFSTQPRMVPQGHPMKSVAQLAVEAYERSEERANWLKSVRKETLEDWLANISVRGIAN